MNRTISIFGLGYVGTVTAACLAHQGNRVIGVDLSADKVEKLNSGTSPIVEPKVNEIVQEAHRANRLSATSSVQEAVLASDVSFLCVGTPSLKNGKLDLGNIEPVCRQIGRQPDIEIVTILNRERSNELLGDRQISILGSNNLFHVWDQ